MSQSLTSGASLDLPSGGALVSELDGCCFSMRCGAGSSFVAMLCNRGTLDVGNLEAAGSGPEICSVTKWPAASTESTVC